MKERPILMSGPLVREILAGRKTQTRRPIKKCPDPTLGHYMEGGGSWSDWKPAACDDGSWSFVSGYVADEPIGRCPYGAPGDRLWVRETWRLIGWDWDAPEARIRYRADDAATTFRTPLIDENWLDRESTRIGNTPGVRDDSAEGDYDGSYAWDDENVLAWRPGIHVPRWACRLVLEVLEVRIERLQSISDEDVRAEGVADCAAFEAKWREIYGAESWDANPWVWVIGFRRLP